MHDRRRERECLDHTKPYLLNINYCNKASSSYECHQEYATIRLPMRKVPLPKENENNEVAAGTSLSRDFKDGCGNYDSRLFYILLLLRITGLLHVDATKVL